jgi:hypothetical protein
LLEGTPINFQRREPINRNRLSYSPRARARPLVSSA